MALPVTALFAGILAVWIIFLAFQVVRFRRANNVALGAGGSQLGECLIRGHGNAVETIPLFLILLGLAEGLGTPVWVLVILGLTFSVGRLLHGVHFMQVRDRITLRFYGMFLTILATGLTALGLIGHSVV